MIVTTTQTVEHRSIGEYLGQVTGQSVWEEQMAKEIMTGIASGPSESAAG
ncbi:MAG: heavy metal-binding domain-containing protein, partial [Syntrophomonadaceae bacterium]|nr:heavy metal-binding domain-containing protein [Syntrophomonadaceae bacterium]